MIDIYICEDNQKQLNLFKKYIENFITIECLDMNIVLATSDPHDILNYILTASHLHNEFARFSLVFLLFLLLHIQK